MNSPYGPPGGQQGPGPYGGPSGAPWGPGQGAPAHAVQPQGAPGGYGLGSRSPSGGPGQGYAPGFGGGPGPAGPSAGGSTPGGPVANPRAAVDFDRILPLVIGGLGVLAFFFGFLSAWQRDQRGAQASVAVYATGGAYLPILLLLTGLLALAQFVDKGRKNTLPTALLAAVGFLAALTQMISGGGSYGAALSAGAGLILLLVVSFLQAAAAAYAWLTESGLVTSPAPSGQRRPRTRKPAAAESAPAAQFASAPPADPQHGYGATYPPGTYPPATYPPGTYPPGGYPPGGYAPGGGQDATGYGSYRPDAYGTPKGQAGEPRNPYAAPESSPAPQQVGTGVTPSVDAQRMDDSLYRPGGRPFESPAADPAAGQPGPDDRPSPDETQQVRF